MFLEENTSPKKVLSPARCQVPTSHIRPPAPSAAAGTRPASPGALQADPQPQPFPTAQIPSSHCLPHTLGQETTPLPLQPVLPSSLCQQQRGTHLSCPVGEGEPLDTEGWSTAVFTSWQPTRGVGARAVPQLTSSASWPRSSGFSSVKRSSCSPAMVISCSSSPVRGEGDISTLLGPASAVPQLSMSPSAQKAKSVPIYSANGAQCAGLARGCRKSSFGARNGGEGQQHLEELSSCPDPALQVKDSGRLGEQCVCQRWSPCKHAARGDNGLICTAASSIGQRDGSMFQLRAGCGQKGWEQGRPPCRARPRCNISEPHRGML